MKSSLDILSAPKRAEFLRFVEALRTSFVEATATKHAERLTANVSKLRDVVRTTCVEQPDTLRDAAL